MLVRRSKPNERLVRALVNAVHEADLVVPLHDVLLINAKGIGPYKAGRAFIPQLI